MSAGVAAPGSPAGWSQFGGDGARGGVQLPGPQGGMQVVKVIEQDPGAVPHERERGFYQNHQASPVTEGDYVVTVHQRGWTAIRTKQTQTYSIQAWQWVTGVSGRTLLPIWKTDTTWEPPSFLFNGGFGTAANGYEPLLQPALTGGSVWMPAAHGEIVRIDVETGRVQAHIRPLAGTAFEGDRATMTTSSVAVDARGNVYYTVVAWDPVPLALRDPRASWLVRVSPSNQVTVVPWSRIVSLPGIPGANDLCSFQFPLGGGPLPPSPTATPPQAACGVQRPSINAAPSFFSNGDLAVYSAANDSRRDNFIIRLDRDTLDPTWAASTNRRALVGCGILIPYGNSSDDCRVGTTVGFDPDYNEPFGLFAPDLVESHIVIAPDDSAILCGYTAGFVFGGGADARGVCLRFAFDGTYIGNSEYGWEVTPAVRRHADGWSLIQDRNRFSDLDQAVVQYSPSFEEEWVANTGEVGGDDSENLNGQLAVDSEGRSYGIDADGVLTQYGRDGEILQSLDLDGDLGYRSTLSTELVLGGDGTLYVPFVGQLYVVQGGGPALAPRAARDRAARPPTAPGAKRKGDYTLAALTRAP